MCLYNTDTLTIEMTEQQTHLQSAIQQQNVLLNEIQKLQTEIDNKRQLAVKAQGIIAVSYTHLTLPTIYSV